MFCSSFTEIPVLPACVECNNTYPPHDQVSPMKDRKGTIPIAKTADQIKAADAAGLKCRNIKNIPMAAASSPTPSPVAEPMRTAWSISRPLPGFVRTVDCTYPHPIRGSAKPNAVTALCKFASMGRQLHGKHCDEKGNAYTEQCGVYYLPGCADNCLGIAYSLRGVLNTRLPDFTHALFFCVCRLSRHGHKSGRHGYAWQLCR